MVTTSWFADIAVESVLCCLNARRYHFGVFVLLRETCDDDQLIILKMQSNIENIGNNNFDMHTDVTIRHHMSRTGRCKY